MRGATLYTFQSKKIMRCNVSNPLWLLGDEAIVDCSGERIAIPVHHIRKVNQDYFLAMEPELAEMLEAPFKIELDKANDALFTLKASLDSCHSAVNRFNSLPWWKCAYLCDPLWC